METNSDPAIPHRLPVHRGGFVDGRSGWQWIRSVEHYLSWRAGDGWRPVGHRFHPDRVYCSAALQTLKRAYYTHPEVAAWWTPSFGEAARIEQQIEKLNGRRRRDRLRATFGVRKGPQSVKAAAFVLQPEHQMRLFA